MSKIRHHETKFQLTGFNPGAMACKRCFQKEAPMNQQLSPADIATMAVQIIPAMSKHDKLMRFAQLVRLSSRPCGLYHRLECYTQKELEAIGFGFSAFAIAAADPVLRDAGFTGVSVADAIGFFELTLDEVHTFSCDCGGELSNRQMADGIEKLALAPRASLFNRAFARVVDSASWTGR
jgi:hypothetical protein